MNIMNNELKALLEKNKKALQFLHVYKRMDFEKPFEVIQGKGKFTANSLKKLINVTDTSEYEIGMFVFVKNVLNPYFINIKSKGFELQNGDDLYKYSYEFKIEKFYCKKQLEEGRKRSDIEWFVVFQKKEHIVPFVNKIPDLTSRFLDCEGYYGKDAYGVRVYFPTILLTKNADCIFDKSNYLLNIVRKNYKIRAEERRAEKKKKEADAFDGFEKAYELKEKIDALAPAFIELINNKEFKKLSLAFSSYKGYQEVYERMDKHIEKLENKSFRSVKDIDISITDIENKYNNICAILNS